MERRLHGGLAGRMGKVAVASIGAVLIFAAMPAPAGAAPDGSAGRRPDHLSKSVTPAEEAQAPKETKDKVLREAKPHVIPTARGGGDAEQRGRGPDGPEWKTEPTPGDSAAAGTATSTSLATAQNGAWPGAYYQNPNRQAGKLYFDKIRGPGVEWGNCSATAVTSENKSTIVTAGHCVYNPDPDNNGVVNGNGYFYEDFRFCPGFENGCKLGMWYYRNVATTNSWAYGVGTARRYDYRDDVALIMMKPNSAGYLVNVVGGQGMTFNNATGLTRQALGYPASDYRWPQYSYNGQDLMYCGARDTYDASIPGTMWISCTMTGGSSGGPWLTSPNSNWMGYVNSVNSHKPYGGAYMSGPYFDSVESNLYQYWRNR